jgi:hypothetical protein
MPCIDKASVPPDAFNVLGADLNRSESTEKLDGSQRTEQEDGNSSHTDREVAYGDFKVVLGHWRTCRRRPAGRPAGRDFNVKSVWVAPPPVGRVARGLEKTEARQAT